MSLQELRQEAQQDGHPQRTIQRGGICLILLAPLLRHLVEYRKEGVGSIGLILESKDVNHVLLEPSQEGLVPEYQFDQ